MHLGIGLGGCRASHRTGRHGAFRAERELTLKEFVRAAFAHYQHDQVSGTSADLEADAAAFDAHGAGRRPTASALAPAGQVSLAVLATDQEGRGLHGRNDDDAVSVFQQFLRDALIGSSHDFGEHRGGFVQPFHGVVVFGQQGHNRQSSRQYHSHMFLDLSVGHAPHRGFRTTPFPYCTSSTTRRSSVEPIQPGSLPALNWPPMRGPANDLWRSTDEARSGRIGINSPARTARAGGALQTCDFSQHVFRPGFLLEVREFTGLMVGNAEFLLNRHRASAAPGSIRVP